MQLATSDDRRTNNPAFQGYLILRTGFALAPMLFGLDTFFNWMVDWPTYTAPWLDRLTPGTARGDQDSRGDPGAALAQVGQTGRGRVACRDHREPADRFAARALRHRFA